MGGLSPKDEPLAVSLRLSPPGGLVAQFPAPLKTLTLCGRGTPQGRGELRDQSPTHRKMRGHRKWQSQQRAPGRGEAGIDSPSGVVGAWRWGPRCGPGSAA
ncbi:hypothetical protein SBRY_20663 [Actinacidiphila bryophytorum]|uniref:Uncharacterized protein n=1 Tax=Actinacidiphila bryophytorum TaxID=1436133 RepID=A0A9W4EDU5_9ACTN|nr:hypothetical protein SBRY_20663 [Actinacidiphila bryophytorum]